MAFATSFYMEEAEVLCKTGRDLIESAFFSMATWHLYVKIDFSFLHSALLALNPHKPPMASSQMRAGFVLFRRSKKRPLVSLNRQDIAWCLECTSRKTAEYKPKASTTKTAHSRTHSAPGRSNRGAKGQRASSFLCVRAK